MPDQTTSPRRAFVPWLVTGVFSLLCCCGVAFGTGYLVLKDKRDESGIRAAGEAYLDAVVRGDYRAAYELLCKRDRREQPFSTWDPTRGSTPPTGFRITDVSIERPEGVGAPGFRTVTADITRSGSPGGQIDILLEKQDGAWKVCRPPKV